MAKKTAKRRPPTNRPASSRSSTKRRAAAPSSSARGTLPKRSSSTPRPKPKTVIVESRREVVGIHAVTYQRRAVLCGKKKCGRCPHRAYWYAFVSFELPTARQSFRTFRPLTRVRCIYIGKHLAALTQQDLDDEEKRAVADWSARQPAEDLGG